MTTKEEATKQWSDRAFGETANLFEEEVYLQAVEDYKKSLREAIEKRIKELESDEAEFSDEEVFFALRECKTFLELLYTVTPTDNKG